MKEKDEFYIGYLDEMPEGNGRFLKKVLMPVFIFIPILVLVVVFFQRPFNSNIFEFGTITEITGTYYASPVPMLVADEGSLEGSLSTDVVLVGYGKFGATGIIKSLEEKNGILNGKKVKIAGTLIHGEGKTLLELSEEEGSLREVLPASIPNLEPFSAAQDVSLTGEIIDPKCYFGVMKHAEGKVHKSCAIRCISGGIPPMLKIKDPQNGNKFYILLSESGLPINKEVLPFVAEQVTISGKTSKFKSWDVLYLSLGDLKVDEQEG